MAKTKQNHREFKDAALQEFYDFYHTVDSSDTRISIKDLRVGDSIKTPKNERRSKEGDARIQKIVDCPSRWRNHRHIHLSNGKVECWWNEATVRLSQ